MNMVSRDLIFIDKFLILLLVLVVHVCSTGQTAPNDTDTPDYDNFDTADPNRVKNTSPDAQRDVDEGEYENPSADEKNDAPDIANPVNSTNEIEGYDDTNTLTYRESEHGNSTTGEDENEPQIAKNETDIVKEQTSSPLEDASGGQSILAEDRFNELSGNLSSSNVTDPLVKWTKHILAAKYMGSLAALYIIVCLYMAVKMPGPLFVR